MRRSFSFLLLFLLAFSSLYADATTKADTQESQRDLDDVEEKAFIKLSDTPQQAAETLVRLEQIEERLTEHEEVLEMDAALPSYLDALQDMLADKVYEHLDTQSIQSIDEMRQRWLVYQKQLRSWQKLLRDRLQVYDENRKSLKELSRLWSETHIHADEEDAPQSIQDHIASVIINIEKLETTSKQNYDMLISDAQKVAGHILKVDEKTEALEAAKSRRLSDVLVVDAAPLLALIQTTSLDAGEYLYEGVQTLKAYYEDIRLYITTNIKELYSLLVSILLISFVIGYLYLLGHQERLFTQGESAKEAQFAFIRRPLSTIIVLSVFASVFLFSERSVAFKHLELLVVIIPVILLLSNIIHRRLLPYVYGFFLLYLLHFFDEGATALGVMERLSGLSIILALFLLICLVQSQRRKIAQEEMSKLMRYSAPISYLLCGLLLIAFVSNVYGAVSLSDRMTKVVFITILALLVFYTLMNVLSGTLILLIRRRIANAPHLLQMHTPRLERNVIGLLTLMMVVWWLFILVNVFGIGDALLRWGQTLLAYSWEFGEMTFSVEGLFDFVVIMIITWFVARLVRIFLTLELFTRFQFARGVPTAISTISNHTIFIIGFIIALSTLGITTQEFAMIGGALGVGIGFGIRNIVANFISGIIMLFERPVQIGDTIEINNTMGSVQTIGTRATAIKTFDGSEVLIPNADFISSDVTNWTLSDERRRATLVIKVDFDSDIEQVLEIMRTVAAEHPLVLEDPAPIATFEGFGDYYLEFKLYYWLSEAIIPTKSDVAIGVFKSLKAHGVKIPTPTRNIAIHERRGETQE